MDFATEYGIRCAEPSDISDWLPTLHDETCRYPGAQVIELGVRTGNSTIAFLAATDLVDGFVWSVDVNPARVPDWWHFQNRWQFIHAPDVPKPDGLPAECDVLFIDTSHHYEHTYAELCAYVPLVRPGGTVLLHDTELQVPDGMPAGDPLFPVARALDRFCAEFDLNWQNRTGCNGLGVVRIPEVTA